MNHGMGMTTAADTLVSELTDIVNGLAVSPGWDQDRVCFAARNAGLYRSSDGGQSWELAYQSLALDVPVATTAVALSPHFPADGTVFAGVSGGVLRSVDGGATWTAATLPAPAPLITTLAVSPSIAADGVVIAGTMDDGVFRSTDRGATWAAWNFGLYDPHVLCAAISPCFADDQTIFVGTESGVFRSPNGGRAWRDVEFSPDHAPVVSIALSPSYAKDGVLFVGTESAGLFRSDDRGQHWIRLDAERMAEAINGIVLDPHFPATPDVLVLLSSALLVSRDGGASWRDWSADRSFEAGTTSVAAPQGLGSGAPLVVGLLEGGVVCL